MDGPTVDAVGDGLQPGDGTSTFDAIGSDAPPPSDTPLPTDTPIPPPPGMTCTPPAMPVAIVNPIVVGTGTAASCTETALRDAVAMVAGGANRPITFNCGMAATIRITRSIDLAMGRSFTFDGGGEVTIDAQGMSRIFYYRHPNFQEASAATLTFQHLTLANGRSSGPRIAVEGTPPCSTGYGVDAGGGAIWIRNARTRVIDVTFRDNQTPDIGPDMGGGGIYVVGNVETVVVGSRFVNGRGANGGGIGSLFGNLRVFNSTFENNRATGFGANNNDMASGCPRQPDGQYQTGSGGNGAAICMDGGENYTVVLCGNTFRNNHANAIGGAVFRTANVMRQTLTVDRCLFDGNNVGLDTGTMHTGDSGAIYVHNARLELRDSTFANNGAFAGAGAIKVTSTIVDFVNTTFFGNHIDRGIGGALALFGSMGTIRNCTFSNNVVGGGGGFFAAAIATGSATMPIDVSNTIFANNTTMDANAGMQCQGMAMSGANNLQWPRNHTVGGRADTPCSAGITFADPMLGALGDNGGPTPTCRPGAPMATVQIGTMCPMTDQTGRARAMPCTCGSVEVPR